MRKPNACFRLGLIHDDGDTDPLSPLVADRTRAAVFYAIGCEEGHARACNALGLKHVEGDGVVTDLPRAAQLFERSCAGNHPKGCFNLALSYEQGRGVPADLPRATTLYDRACRRGLESACEGHRRLAHLD
jgi:TPR repeat protein